MMTKLLFTFIFWMSAVILYAQSDYDIIYLKNGTIYKGNVTEYVPEGQAIIKLLDDRIITVQTDNIMHMSIGRDNIIKKQFDLKEKGYFHNSIVGLLLGRNSFGNTQASLAYNMVNGYRIKDHHMGLGLGFEAHTGNWYLPVYADYSYHIMKGHFSPVVGINGGILAPLNKATGSEYDYTRGSFMGGYIGLISYSSPRWAFVLNITYRYIHLSGAEYTDVSPWGERYDVNGSARLNRLGFMLGFAFN